MANISQTEYMSITVTNKLGCFYGTNKIIIYRKWKNE